jgi:hypothetical protein
MKRLLGTSLIAALFSGLLVFGQEAPPPRPKQSELLPPRPKLQNVAGIQPAVVINPNQVAQLVDKFTADFVESATKKGTTVEEKAAYRQAAIETVAYMRFVAWHAIPVAIPNRPTFLRDFRTIGELWFNQMHFNQSRVVFRNVPGSNGLIRWFDLREPGWSAAAWTSVARRDLTFREPVVEPNVANRLRIQAGLIQDPKTLSVEVVVWGPQLFRDTVESQRTPSYYDLLYSEFRFIENGEKTSADIKPLTKKKFKEEIVIEKRTVSHPGGKTNFPVGAKQQFDNLPPGNYIIDVEVKKKTEQKVPDPTGPLPSAPVATNVKFVDFPQTHEDFEDVFKPRQVKGGPRAFGRKSELQYLAVVPGMHDDAVKGSFVALRNRLVKFAIGNALGGYQETFDVLDGTDKQDFLQQSKDIIQGKQPKFDAQELLGGLPAGGQAGFLNNAQGKRIESADGNVARGIPLKPNLPYIYSPVVRNPGDCVRCHGLTYGIIDPADLVQELILDRNGKGVSDINFRDPGNLIKYQGAFREMKKRNEGWRVAYRELVEESSTEEFGKGWTGPQYIDAFEHAWNWYDSPVTSSQAAFELGIPELFLKIFKDESLSVRAHMVANNRTIPTTSVG